MWDVDIGINVIQVPLEALAAQLLSEHPPLRYISKGLLETNMANDSST